MNSQPQQVEIEDYSAFLAESDWRDASVKSLGADMGQRRYYLLEKEGKTALLMDMSRSGYEAGLQQYLKIAEYLAERGIHTPTIYHFDPQTGLSIIEDMGQVSFGDAVRADIDKKSLYRLATEVLVSIRRNCTDNTIHLGAYKDSLIRDRLKQFVDFYMNFACVITPTEAIHAEFEDVWAQIDRNLGDCPMGFSHADYHLENLMWRPETEDKYGLIDFQDAFWGPQPYDLLNLLEDARQTVPEDIKQEMKALYCEGMSAQEQEAFYNWYVVLSAHFHCRVVGLFVKFPKETGTEAFLEHIPRLQGYIRKGLENPVLSPLKEFIDRHSIRLDVSIDEIKKNI